MITQKLVTVRISTCSKCAYYLNQKEGMTECRFPKGKVKQCTREDKWLECKVYINEWIEDNPELLKGE